MEVFEGEIWERKEHEHGKELNFTAETRKRIRHGYRFRVIRKIMEFPNKYVDKNSQIVIIEIFIRLRRSKYQVQ